MSEGEAVDPLRTTIDLYLRQGRERRDTLFAISNDERVTYGQILDRALRLAASLVRLGLAPGDRVANWMGNSIAWVITKFGVEFAGGVHVPLSTHLRIDDASHVLLNSQATVLIFDDSVDSLVVHDLLIPQPARSRFPDLRIVISNGQAVGDFVAFSDLVTAEGSAEEAELSARWAQIQPDDLSNILYTSGTTGASKGAMLSHRNILANVASGPRCLNRTSTDRWLVALPLFHTFGCMMGLLYPWSLGASIVILPRFSASTALAAIEEHQCTVVEGVPTMFSDILEHPDRTKRDLRNWSKIYMGGSYSSATFIERLHAELNVDELLTGFGMTEHSGLSMTTRTGDAFELVSTTIGAPLDGAYEFAILDQDGQRVPDGDTGEICARGTGVFAGYYRDEAQTAAAFHPSGWMRSGDLGRLDVSSGYFQITGRLKDIIICGGENIAPAEIENLIIQHPLVAEVYVCGVPDPRLGEIPAAFVRAQPGTSVTADELMDYCRSRVSSYKVPRIVTFMTEFPRTATGKVQRFRLAELADIPTRQMMSPGLATPEYHQPPGI